MNLKNIIEKQNTAAGKFFDLFIQLLIILSIIAFSIETIPNLSESTMHLFNIFEKITITIFTLEYILRLVVADKKISYIFSFNGLIDLIAVLPYYLTVTVDLRGVRAIRIVRLLRLSKLFKYSASIDIMVVSFSRIKAELSLLLFLTFILLYLSSIGIYYFENSTQPDAFASVFHCMWWAICTLTTVGYGDIAPITAGGKIFASLVCLLGIGVVAVPTGLLTASFISVVKEKKVKEDEQLKLDMNDL